MIGKEEDIQEQTWIMDYIKSQIDENPAIILVYYDEVSMSWKIPTTTKNVFVKSYARQV